MIVQSVLIALVLGALRISTAVGEQTIHDGIPNIVQQPETANGPYGFDPSRTWDEGFTLGRQFYSNVKWLPIVTKSSYYKRGHFSDIPASFLELDYVDFSMIVVLPDQGAVLNEWHRKLENVDFPLLLSETELQPTRIYLPKLKLNYSINPGTEYEDSHENMKYWNSGTLYNRSNKSLHFNGSTDTFLEIDVLGVHNLGSFHNGPLWGEYHSGKQEDFRVNRPFIVMILQNNEIVLQALIERPMENSYILQKKIFPSTETTTPDGLTVSYTTENNMNGTQESSSQLAEEVNLGFDEELATIKTTHPEKEITTVGTITPTSQPLSMNSSSTTSYSNINDYTNENNARLLNQSDENSNLISGFDESPTLHEPFHKAYRRHWESSWSIPVVPSMRISGYFRRGRIPFSDASFIELIYQDFTMIVILPDDVSNMVSLNEKLENFEFSSLLEKQKLSRTYLYLPKFRLDIDYSSRKLENIDNWNIGYLYNRPNSSMIPKSREIFIAINESGIITPTTESFHNGPTTREALGYGTNEFRVERSFMVVILKDNQPIIKARIVDPEENEYILKIKDPREIGIPTVVYPETSTTLRYNDVTPTYPPSTGSAVKSTGIAEDTSHVETTTWHPFSTNSPTPTGSPLKYVYTYDGKEGRYNESGFIGNKSLVIETISEGISNANGTDAGFANHMDMVKNVLDHAVKTSESKSESVKGSRLMEWIYRKFSKKNETEGAKTMSTSEGTESILTIFN